MERPRFQSYNYPYYASVWLTLGMGVVFLAFFIYSDHRMERNKQGGLEIKKLELEKRKQELAERRKEHLEAGGGKKERPGSKKRQ